MISCIVIKLQMKNSNLNYLNVLFTKNNQLCIGNTWAIQWTADIYPYVWNYIDAA